MPNRVRLLAALLSLALALGYTMPRVEAAPSGKLWTSYITVAIGLAAILNSYFVNLSKSKGSTKAGDAVIDADLQPALTPNPSSPHYSWSLRDFRNLTIYDVATSNAKKPEATTNWRQHFEHLRGCWNANLVQPKKDGSSKDDSKTSGQSGTKPPGGGTPSPQPTDHKQAEYRTLPSATLFMLASNHVVILNQASDFSDASTDSGGPPRPAQTQPGRRGPDPHTIPGPAAGSTSSPAPHSTSSSSDGGHGAADKDKDSDVTASADPCNMLIADYSVAIKSDLSAAKLPFDVTDAVASLKDPSLYQQVLDQDVGSFVGPDNAGSDIVRAAFLGYMGKQLTNEIATDFPSGLRGSETSASPGTFQPYQDVVTNCITGLNALSCISNLATIQQGISKAQAQKEACTFAKWVWIPTFTEITKGLAKPKPLQIDMSSGAIDQPQQYDAGFNPDGPNGLATMRHDFGAAVTGC